ncbi:TVP38/TMEM64 family protein [Rubripirellula amarantea]|nr:VTT domain-containing protein [Rubripirellula amarantea]
MMRSRSQVYRYIPPLMMVAIGTTLLCRGFELRNIHDWVDSFGATAPIVFVAVGVILMSLFVPKTVMSITAGAMFGTGWGSGLMLVTALLAAALNYMIGRLWVSGSSATDENQSKSVPAGDIISTMRQMAADANFAGHLLLRLSPVPTMIISYTMGACHAKIVPYIVAAAVAMIPQILWVHSGTASHLIGDADASPEKWTSIALAVVGGLLVSVLIPREVLRRLRDSRTIEGAAT